MESKEGRLRPTGEISGLFLWSRKVMLDRCIIIAKGAV